MDNEIVQTPPPHDIHIPLLPPNIKVKHKKEKSKKNITTPKVINPNSKNQSKKKAKEISRQLFKITNKLNKMT